MPGQKHTVSTKAMLEQIEHPTASPIRVNAQGVQSFLQHGGLLMIYREGCPYCEALHTFHGTDTVLSRLAAQVHGTGQFVCVCNADDVVGDACPTQIQGMVGPYPTLLVANRTAVERHTGGRTTQELFTAIEKLRGVHTVRTSAWSMPTLNADVPRVSAWDIDTDDTTMRIQSISDDTQTYPVQTTEQIIHFLERNDGYLVPCQRDYDAAIELVENAKALAGLNGTVGVADRMLVDSASASALELTDTDILKSTAGGGFRIIPLNTP